MRTAFRTGLSALALLIGAASPGAAQDRSPPDSPGSSCRPTVNACSLRTTIGFLTSIIEAYDVASGTRVGFAGPAIDGEMLRDDPLIGGGIAGLIRSKTALIWCESPGSITMEVQDVPAIVRAAHARGVAVALDNTFAAGVLFDAFAHGVDVSVQALTKFGLEEAADLIDDLQQALAHA